MKDQLDALVNELIEHGILFEDAVSEFEKRFIRGILEKSNGNTSKAAKALGIHRNTLSRKIAALKLDDQPKRQSKPRR
ncbi:MAG TPA: helix-turn-helix domain-containing protein [Terriglobia bacterium]|nr:helix-turn-helix domain-containing protein [Terriglobia bacterium]